MLIRVAVVRWLPTANRMTPLTDKEIEQREREREREMAQIKDDR